MYNIKNNNLEEYGKTKIQFDKFKKLQKKLGIKSSKLINIKNMEQKYNKLNKEYKKEKTYCPVIQKYFEGDICPVLKTPCCNVSIDFCIKKLKEQSRNNKKL